MRPDRPATARRAATERFGRYVVYEQLGAGGMASVHRAEVLGGDGLRTPVALKRILPRVASDRELVGAFVREAWIAGRLHHANIAETYDVGKVDNTHFIAMELIVGRDLRRTLGSARHPVPVPIALEIVSQVCAALAYAHRLTDENGRPLEIIHRDVSLSNVIVSDAGIVKLIDFGIAKASAAGMQTRGGRLKGKCGYMAPEYVRGSIDARADLFALGVVAYELLTAKPLFSVRDDGETLNRVLTMPVEPPSTKNPAVPAEIDDIVMTALARDPASRWQHATALRNALATVTRRLGMVVCEPTVADWLRDEPRSHRSTRMPSDHDTLERATVVRTVTPVTSPRSARELADPRPTAVVEPPRVVGRLRWAVLFLCSAVTATMLCVAAIVALR